MFHTYRRLCTRLGAAMLCQFFLINVLMSGVVLVLSLFADSMDPRTYNLIDQLVYAALYLAGFMLPVLFFRLLSRGETAPPPDMTPALTWRAIPFVFAVIGANLPCAYLNSLFMQLLSSMGISNILDFVEMPIVYPEDFVLLHMTLALVPAFCEEFLFRGLICRRLMPYGKTVAIVGSAVLFGLMHGNLGQLFYTTMAGVLLAWCYVETRSIWPGVIAHMLNNLLGFISESWYQRLPEPQAALYDTFLSMAVMFVGMLCFVWLLCARRTDEPVIGLGHHRPLDEGPVIALPMRDCVRGFFNPAMIVYVVLSLGGILLYLLLGI
ncbi:MAG: CPBP family intramembrane metalloprotease [Clostridia bacterium]|nr:CPBP family intramembrane metalloprotease [Clostridia bacterium]